MGIYDGMIAKKSMGSYSLRNFFSCFLFSFQNIATH